MNYPIYKQGNYSQQLGTGPNGPSIALDGCAECDIASLLVWFGKQTDPLKLNQDLISIGGYADNGNGQHDLIIWSIISQLYSDITLAYNNLYPSTPADMSLIDEQLGKGFPVIVGVSFSHDSSATQPSHYVVIYQKNPDGTYQCMDPYFGDEVVYDTRYAVNGMSVAQSILQAVSYNGTITEPDVNVDPVTFQKLVTNSTSYDSVCDEVGEPHNTTGSQVVADIAKLKTDLSTAQQTISTLNQQLPTLKTDNETLSGQVKTLQQQLQDAQAAAIHPSSGIDYQKLYIQSEAKVTAVQTQLQAAQTALNTAKTQYASTSALAMSKTQLLQTLLSRFFSGK